MRAIGIERFGGPAELGLLDLPRSRPGFGEVLLRVVAAGVDPLDAALCQGRLRTAAEPAFPLVPGWQAAGVIESIGEGTAGVRRGERVVACTFDETTHRGCYAEHVVLSETRVARMPTRFLYEEAAAVPLPGLLALAALGDLELLRVASVVVWDPPWSVGPFAIGLARAAGATVRAVAAEAIHDHAVALGAAAVVPDAGQAAQLGGVDLVVGSLGDMDLGRALELVRPGGVVATTDLTAVARPGVRHVALEGQCPQLGRLVDLVERHGLRPRVARIFDLAAASEAHRALASAPLVGSLVLQL